MTILGKLKFFFDNNEYVVLENYLRSDLFLKYSEKIQSEVNSEYTNNLNEIKKLGGYLTGNLDLIPSEDIYLIWKELKKNNFKEIFKLLIDDNLEDYDITFRGNISIPNKGSQFFHTDGPIKSRKILIGIAISNVNEIDGPTVLIPGTHKKQVEFWKFYLTKFFQNKKKIILKKGDIFIRESHIWHKGSKNKSNKLRTQLLLVLTKKKNNEKPIKQIFGKSIKFGPNMFGTSFKEKIKEFLSVYFSIIFFLSRIFMSIFKK